MIENLLTVENTKVNVKKFESVAACAPLKKGRNAHACAIPEPSSPNKLVDF